MSEFSDFEDEEGVDEPVNLGSDDEEEQEEEIEATDHPLTKDMLPDCLSLICKVGGGLSYAYVRLDVHDRELTDISIINSYIHLRYLDVSSNKLKDISTLSSLTHLLTLKADKNLLRSVKLEELPYLQIANFAGNKIMDTEGIRHPLLEVLNLKNNEIIEITGLDPIRLGKLHTLELRGNKLISTKGLIVPSLKTLYLASNNIREIEDLSRLEHLTFLHLRNNKLETLDGFSENMKNLQYLNIRENSITDFFEIEKLKCLPNLKALVLTDNPISVEDNCRVEILAILRTLERLDKADFHEEEKRDAKERYEQKLTKPENPRTEIITSEEDED